MDGEQLLAEKTAAEKSVLAKDEFFDPFVMDYDESDYGFINEIREILNILHLHYAHRLIDVQLATRATDQFTKLHEVYYHDERHLFHNIYHKFLKEIIAPRLNLLNGLIYQKIPTFRVHMPGSVAVGEFHKDTQYSHNPHAINCWIPLTRTYEANTIWLESYPNAGDYKPILMMPGECLLFQGGLLTHGNKVNDSGFTRLSFDFRVLRPEHYDPNESKRSVNTCTKLIIGEYYAVLGHPDQNVTR